MDNTWEEPIESNIDAKFLEHFNSQIKPKLAEIEKKRNKLSFMVGCATILAISAFLVLLNSQDTKNDLVGLIAGLIFPLCFGLIRYWLSYYKSIVIDELKEPIFSYFDDFLYMKFKRECKRRIEYWRHIKMMSEFDCPPIVDDYIIGTYKDVPVEIEEIRLCRRARRRDAIVFNGVILTLPQLKMVTTPLIIRDMLCGGTRIQGQDVQLGDAEFNNIFEISSNDPIEARYILTPTFMEDLKKLHHKGILVTLCFQDEKIYIAVHTRHDMFELSFNKSVYDVEQYYKIIKEFEDILKIIDILKLDQKAVL